MAARRPVTSPVALAAVAHDLELPVIGDIVITGITHDSREVQPGDLYVAIPGQKNHGIEFMEQAIASGAVAVASDGKGVAIAQNHGIPTIELSNPRKHMAHLAQRIYGFPDHKLVMIGITGTNGKTTVASMVRHILTISGHKSGMIGTLGAFAGDEFLAGLRTTPESTDLYATLGYMVDSGVSHVVMEVSSHGLELERVAGLTFSTSVFTNLSQDHLDFHGSMDSYFAAKAKLFTMTKHAVINIDDTYGKKLMSAISERVSVVTIGEHADVSASNLTTSQNGTTSFDVYKMDERAHVDLPMIGEFNVSNALCAIVATTQVGISLLDACTALASFPGVPGRCERVMPSGRALAIVDYAHTPDAVEKILRELRRVTQSRLICVLGCGGDRDPSKRYDMGKIAAALSDVTVITDDNPRSEDPQTIRNEVMRGAKSESSELHEIGDRHEAIAYAIHTGEPGDIVAVLGKGHELGQEVDEHIFPFDDREVIRRVSANA